MGLDFIRRTAKTFTKTWNHGASELANPSLFTRYPECQARSVIAVLDSGANVPTGTRLTISAEGDRLAIVCETRRVGVIETVPADLLNAIKDSGGCALGEIKNLNPISGTADVEIQ